MTQFIQCPVVVPGFLAVAPRGYYRFHSPGLGLRHDGGWCRSPGRPADTGPAGQPSANGLGCSPPPCPRSKPTEPAFHGHQRPGAVCCSAPFCAAYGLIASPCSSPVGMNLDVAGVYHQPLKVRIVDDRIQQLLPDTPVPPATEAPMGVFPVPVIRWQVPPWSTGTQNPEHRVQKQPVVSSRPTSFASVSRQKGSQSFPNLVRYIVTSMRCRHSPTPHSHTFPSTLPSSSYFDDTA